MSWRSEGRPGAKLLRDAGALALGVGAFGRFASTARAAQPARVVVVGAGLAGLTAAYRLRQAGCVAAVHEGSDRVGGRCWTIRGVFADGQIGEHGGELIDQGHTELRQLAQELGLELDNLVQGEQNGSEPAYFFDGAPYPVRDATLDLRDIWSKLHSDLLAASYPTLYNSSTPRGRVLDQMSIVD
jgi:monoamine oxidase